VGTGEAIAEGLEDTRADGETRTDGDGIPVREWAAWRVAPVPLPSLPAAGFGAAQCVKGACGPPANATTTASRQTPSAAASARPARSISRRRRPDGSVNTGPECIGDEPS
jgi:hypothetical protein